MERQTVKCLEENSEDEEEQLQETPHTLKDIAGTMKCADIGGTLKNEDIGTLNCEDMDGTLKCEDVDGTLKHEDVLCTINTTCQPGGKPLEAPQTCIRGMRSLSSCRA